MLTFCILVKKFNRSLFQSAIPKTCCSTKATGQCVRIGKISKFTNDPQKPELVPTGYNMKVHSQEILGHLQWIMKKDLLGQDMFLIGMPGPLRRRLIYQYAELMQQEVEYVVLSRDTTDSDLKQRREIVSGTAYYKDQSAIKAAIEGRILVLDGVEKAERNVLPVLNNLLENREIQLEDGRFLVSPERYDKLLSENLQEILDSWKLVRVSEKFRVVALGLPIPLYRGHPLDPPFRSRFQARDVKPSYDEQIQELTTMKLNPSTENIKKIFSLCHTFSTEESTSLGMPKFPVESLQLVAQILKYVPNIPPVLLFEWMYPYKLFLQPESKKYIKEHLKALKFSQKLSPRTYVISEEDPSNITIEVQGNMHYLNFNVYADNKVVNCENFIDNDYHKSVLSDMFLTHLSHDFCLIGSKGSGKTMLVKKFAELLNYRCEMMMLYKDMTSRDLLQQRATDNSGNTLWKPSSLVTSALNGNLVVLDGLNRLHPSTLSVLHSLIHDREVQLYDGTRLLRHDRYDAIKKKYGFSDSAMLKKNIYRIHPSFRVIALAEPPSLQNSKNQWLTPEVLSMFLFHSLRQLSLVEEKHIIEQLLGPVSEKMEVMLNFAHMIRNSTDEALSSIGNSLSTRQLIRMAQRLSVFPHQDIHTLISQACLTKFLPSLTRQAIETAFKSSGISEKEKRDSVNRICTVKDGIVTIGNTSTAVYKPGKNKVKVPDILFYDNPEHISIMESMLQDFVLGEHLLLIGNQGVGKNKIVDRFLQFLNYPREYIQLHRDTTVQSLTQQPSVIDNCIIYEDSPLVKAVQNGHVLVVDEADKAPTHVTCILKALVESGEMVLSDGRSIVHHTDPRGKIGSKDIITMHPDFRMIVLANRPGFPFLGNDFFATLGDIFSCHSVENPSLESEITMLRKYGPNVPLYLLEKLVRLFGDLRTMSDHGIISYPYSTREVVNVVKHLEKFPSDGLPHVLRSVFDFDTYNKQLKETLYPIFHKHGIPFDSRSTSIHLGKSFDLQHPKLSFHWDFVDETISCPSSQQLKVSYPYKQYVENVTLGAVEARSNVFSEQKKYWKLPIGEDDVPLDVVVTQSGGHNIISVVTGNPVSVLSLNTFNNLLYTINLSNVFPPVRRGFKPKVKLAALGSHLKDSLLLYEKSTNQIFIVNFCTGSVTEVCITSALKVVKEKLSKMLNIELMQKQLEMCSDLAQKNIIFFYSNLSNEIITMDLNHKKILNFEIPDFITSVSAIDGNILLLQGKDNTFFVNISNFEEWKILKFNSTDGMFRSEAAGRHEAADTLIHSTLGADKGEFLSILSNPSNFASVAVGDPNYKKRIDVFHFVRETPLTKVEKNSSVLIGENSQIARKVHIDDTSNNLRNSKLLTDSEHYLEITDLNYLKVLYIPIVLPSDISSLARWLVGTSNSYLLMHPLKTQGFVTVDAKGYIRIWETVQVTLQNSLEEWFKVTGSKKEQQLTIEKENAPDVSGPKHGKVDSTGAPHVGGNTWAGGTGGRDTAGLGGKGGPYRLDAGHDVFQLPDSEKDAVPPEVKKAAREMALKAYRDKLKEIEMSEYDAEMYGSIFSNVKKQVSILRTILDSLHAKTKERQWLRHQTSGELDDTRLIEGITGEKNIYRKRGEEEPEMGSPQEKPKKLRILVDVSGSMYRFNGHDKRLERELESVVLVMEAFDGYHDKFQYDVIGHSGEDFCIPFISFSNPPQNNKERLDVLKKMYAHSQFCFSGDNTLRATKHAIESITKEEADEHFVIVMSDANFDRYGISPKAFNSLLSSDSKVNSFALFIGTLGDQADRLHQQLPPGRGFICLDTKQLPFILQQIFTSALLKEQ